MTGAVRGMLLGLTLTGAVAASLTCGGSSSRSNCVPGASVACSGPAQCGGYQICSEDGNSLGPCVCPAGALNGDGGTGGGSEGGQSAPTDANGGPTEGGGGGVSDGSSPNAEGGYPGGSTDGGTGTCKYGKYSGAFTCTAILDSDAGGSPEAGGPPLVFNGTIALALDTSDAAPPGLGSVSGWFGGGTNFAGGTIDGGFSGSLICGSGAFDGAVAGGTVALSSVVDSVSGTLASEYDGSAFDKGTLALRLTHASCPGTWSASYTGP